MRLFPAIRATLTPLLLIPFFSGCSLLFVNGPVPGWETANADDLATFALTQPCTNSKTLSIIDGVIGALDAVYGIAIFSDKQGYEDKTDLNANFVGTMSFVWGGLLGYSMHKGDKNVNDCRAFNARLLESRRGDAVGQATYNWLDEFSPVPDFGVDPPDLPVAIPPLRWFDQLFPVFPAPDFGANAFDPVFRGAISNSPDQ